jgi:hypothetical protein
VPVPQDLEDRVARVHNPEVRPLVQEAFRSYSVGSYRACIVLVWTAVVTDLLHKIAVLHEDGEPDPRKILGRLDEVRGRRGPEEFKKMQAIEGETLEAAREVELIDDADRDLLHRLKEDRNACAHPSLRPAGELFAPSAEYARAHLVTALDAVLEQPASQGQKAVDRYRDFVSAPVFGAEAGYLRYTYFERVRPRVRKRIIDFTAKHAVLELDPGPGVNRQTIADRYAKCLLVFHTRDPAAVKAAMEKALGRLATSEHAVQLRAAARLWQLDAFWDVLPEALRTQYNESIKTLGEDSPNRWRGLPKEWVILLRLVTGSEHRRRLPALAVVFPQLPINERQDIIAGGPDPYFAQHLAALMGDVRSYDEGEEAARTALLPNAPSVTLSDAQAIFSEWTENPQCWGRAMASYAGEFYRALSPHIGGDELDAAWDEFLNGIYDERVREDAREAGEPEIEV